MPSRINHVKVVSPHPEVVNAFLTQVCDIPEGWAMGSAPAPVAPDAPLGSGGELPLTIIDDRRHADPQSYGYIAGDPASRQFQLVAGDRSQVWSVCISTRDLESIYDRARARGVPCTAVTVADWNERDNIRNFFCLVDDLLFEVIRVEPKRGIG
jgi:hypothetical protein